MQKIVATKEQKRTLIIGGIIMLVFVIFITIVYLPLRQQSIRLKSELDIIESEINQIKKASTEGKTLEGTITDLKNKLEMLDKKFPEKEEVILRELSALAAKLNIEVGSIRPQRKRVVKEIGSIAINIKDCFVQEMPISMSLKTSYKRLGEFLKSLGEELPVFMRIDTIQMARSRTRPQNPLEVELNLNTYLVCSNVK